jgi:hypothetical protein
MSRSPRASPFSRRERLRLWLSYQRYAILLPLACAAALGALVALASVWAWAWLGLIIMVPVAITTAGFTLEVVRAYSRKLRATWAQERRMAAGRFSPEALRSYCGDPCWRVVANEILTRAGYSRTQRRALIQAFRRELDSDAHAVVIVDHLTGAVRRIGASSDVITFNSDQAPHRPPHRPTSLLGLSTRQVPNLEPGRSP